MRVALVNAPVKVHSPHARMSPPLGLAYLGAALLEAGHRVVAVDFNISGLNLRRVDRLAEYDKPAVVGISAMTETYPNALAIARRLKEANPTIAVVLGGAHPSIMPHEVLSDDAVDFVVVGDGESAIVRLVSFLESGEGRVEQIAGLGYKRDGVLHVNERAPLPDPDELPVPARELFPLDFYSHAINVLTATGSCPYRCPFCSAASIWEGRRKMRSPESIVTELRMLVEGYGIDQVFFTDDIFTLDKKWVYRLCEELRTLNNPVDWECATRVDLVDGKLLREMSSAGCVGVQFGVESGCQDILDSVKGVSKQQVRAAVEASVKADIHTACSFMVPFPEDTLDTLEESGQFMKTLHEAGAEILLSYTTPYPGTYFYEHAEELGLRIITDRWEEYDAKHVVMETRHLSAAQIEVAVEEIAHDVGMQWSTQGQVFSHSPHDGSPIVAVPQPGESFGSTPPAGCVSRPPDSGRGQDD
ncbi:MAG: B12-binding domain-containing radical SAM protein [Coriobacteriia bacterium]